MCSSSGTGRTFEWKLKMPDEAHLVWVGVCVGGWVCTFREEVGDARRGAPHALREVRSTSHVSRLTTHDSRLTSDM